MEPVVSRRTACRLATAAVGSSQTSLNDESRAWLVEVLKPRGGGCRARGVSALAQIAIAAVPASAHVRPSPHRAPAILQGALAPSPRPVGKPEVVWDARRLTIVWRAMFVQGSVA